MTRYAAKTPRLSSIRKFGLIPLTALAGGTLLLLSACSYSPPQDTGVEVQVSGQGEIRAVPDQAVISAALQLQGEESRALLQQADTIMTRVLAALNEAGIDDRFIQAGQLQLQPRWHYSDGKRQPDGFEVQRPLHITLNDIHRYPAIIDLLSAQGITSFSEVRFDNSDKQQLIDDATAQAVMDARHKATVMAQALGMPHCKPVQIANAGNNFPVPRLAMAKMAVASESGNAYNPGEQLLTAHVSATFSCRQ